MGFFQRIFGGGSAQQSGTEALYVKVMAQSRRPEFFGPGRMPDSYDGRVEILTVHLAPLMFNIQVQEENAGVATGKNNEESVSQALFDIMVKDFDTALREEGFTDTGVKKRIKPIVGFFYKRLKTLTESMTDKSKIEIAISSGPVDETSSDYISRISTYLDEFDDSLKSKTLAELVEGKFSFPKF